MSELPGLPPAVSLGDTRNPETGGGRLHSSVRSKVPWKGSWPATNPKCLEKGARASQKAKSSGVGRGVGKIHSPEQKPRSALSPPPPAGGGGAKHPQVDNNARLSLVT